MRHIVACLIIIAMTALALLSWAGERGQPLPQPEARKLLADPKPLVRLQAALALAQRDDEQAIGVLIDLLADLHHAERLQAEQVLQELAGEWSPNPALSGDDELSRKIRREAWAGWWRTLDGPTLLSAFRQRASGLEKLAKLPPSTPRLLAIRKPPGATDALLAFLPFTDDYSMKEAIGKALKSLVMVDGKPDPVVLKALNDPQRVRRIAAAETLAGAGGAANWPAARKLLQDPDLEVRLRVALALVRAQDKEAVPALIDLVSELPRSKAWEAEDLLYFLAGAKGPAILPGDDAAARQKLAEAWKAWWKSNGPTLKMAELEKAAGLGLTLVAEIAPQANRQQRGKGGPDRVVALDRDKKPRWQIDNLNHPIDVRLLPGERVLIAEYDGNRITERDLKGNILWEMDLPAYPGNVQRLANGNTFVALCGAVAIQKNGSPLMEVDRAGTIKATFHVKAGGGGALPKAVAGNSSDMMYAAQKMADGRMICLMNDDTCVWLDAVGKELKRFAVPQAKAGNTFGNIDMTPQGHILVARNNNTVAEYDTEGKVVWQANAIGQRVTRLANGNTLVASLTAGVIELDNAGGTVWQYMPPGGFQATRARRY